VQNETAFRAHLSVRFYSWDFELSHVTFSLKIPRSTRIRVSRRPSLFGGGYADGADMRLIAQVDGDV
jgi:hypothetical protein